MEERFGSWIVEWLEGGITVRSDPSGAVRYYPFPSVVLPVLFVGGPLQGFRAVLSTDAGWREELLAGASAADVERFKKKLSGEVLAAVKRSAGGCADCASDAGLIATTWAPGPCPACRRPYCGNPKCLRRMRTITDSDGRRLCKYCGAAGETGDVARRVETST